MSPLYLRASSLDRFVGFLLVGKSFREGCFCHGLARGHALSLGQPTIPRLPTIEVGKRDVSLEAHSIQDLEELADVAVLWDVRDRATAVESRQETDG